MEMIVEKIIDEGDEICVFFSSEYGFLSALWEGDKPTINEIYDVELEVDDDFVWEENIYKAMGNETRIELKGGVYTIYGRVINLEEDGCLSVSLGDSVILLDTENLPKYISGLIECKAFKVKLYPTGL